jgi:hypothetical protein
VNRDELQDRVCRACGRGYQYPVRKSLATRFYCEACMNLDADVRAMFEHFHKKLKSLSRELNALKSKTRGDGS